MSPVDLLSVLRQSFESCETVGDDTFRCERRFKGTVRGVYFFRQVARLPTVSELAAFQQEVVAPSYFASSGATRWSHYVVFVLGRKIVTDDLSEKFSLEADINYARKIVVSFYELADFLKWDVSSHVEAEKPNALQQEWMRTLAAAGISNIASDLPRTAVVRAIKMGTSNSDAIPSTVAQIPRDNPSLFITRLAVERFGDRAISGEFKFGTVTLVRGVNGAGKTSLLEAVEHFLCGATRRSGGRTESLRATASFSNGKEVGFSARPASFYQDKDLRWYGRTTNKGNKLFEGFARYNFLNADAAVELARDDGLRDLKAALSKIALGPDASHTWNRIQEFLVDIGREINPLSNQLGILESKRIQAYKRLETLRVASPQVSSRISLLTERLREMNWPVAPLDGEQLVDFQPYALLRAAVDAFPVRCPAVLEEVSSEILFCQDELNLVSAWERECDDIRVERSEIEVRRIDLDADDRRLTRLERYLAVGFEKLFAESTTIANQSQVATTPPLTLVERQIIDILRRMYGNILFASVAELVRESCLEAARTVGVLSERKAAAERALREHESLIGQLKALARQHVVTNGHDDRCPVCDTEVGNQELLRRLERAKPSATVSLLHSLSAELESKSIGRQNSDATLALVERILAADRMFGAMPIDDAIALMESRREQSDALEARASELNRKLTDLSRDGYSRSELEGLVVWLRVGREGVEDLDVGAGELQAKRESLKERRRRILARIAEIENVEKDLRTNLAGRASAFGAADVTLVKSAVRSRLDSLSTFVESFRALPDGTQSVFKHDLLGFQESCGRVLAEMESIGEQLQTERARVGELQLLQDQIAHDDGSIAGLRRERDNLRASHAALLDITERHSLDNGLSAFLQQNLGSIQSIFARIHSPNELKLSELAECQLVRVGSGRLADLSQISTGQRSALMLSIFLTLNLSLRSGPPLMLIDDPVAHVDDLNSLAFLDFLADVAEGGRRQIVLATADDRLANLFEKKMGFLGDDFSVIELTKSSARVH